MEPQEAMEFSQTHPIYKCAWFLETELLFLPHCQTCEREHEPYLFKLQGVLTSMRQLRAVAGFIIKKADKRGECSVKERKGARKSSRNLEYHWKNAGSVSRETSLDRIKQSWAGEVGTWKDGGQADVKWGNRNWKDMSGQKLLIEGTQFWEWAAQRRSCKGRAAPTAAGDSCSLLARRWARLALTRVYTGKIKEGGSGRSRKEVQEVLG